MCGSDYDLYQDRIGQPLPLVGGHEIVGRIASIHPRTEDRWHVSCGDRVAVQATVACGACERCASGRESLCERRLTYGFTPLTTRPATWGGYAERMALHPNTR